MEFYFIIGRIIILFNQSESIVVWKAKVWTKTENGREKDSSVKKLHF